jgi:hypothetical protein
MVAKLATKVGKHKQTRTLYTNQGFFNNRFIFMLSNGDFMPRDVPAHDHLNKIRTDTSILINGARLVLEISKFTQPNELIKK